MITCGSARTTNSEDVALPRPARVQFWSAALAMLGDRPLPLSPETEGASQDDIDHELYGTTDVGHAISDGTAWIPPESPTQEGMLNDRNARGEDH